MSKIERTTQAAPADAKVEEAEDQAEEELDLSDLFDDGILEEAERIKERLRHTSSGE